MLSSLQAGCIYLALSTVSYAFIFINETEQDFIMHLNKIPITIPKGDNRVVADDAMKDLRMKKENGGMAVFRFFDTNDEESEVFFDKSGENRYFLFESEKTLIDVSKYSSMTISQNTKSPEYDNCLRVKLNNKTALSSRCRGLFICGK